METTWNRYIDSLHLDEESLELLHNAENPQYLVNKKNETLTIRVNFPVPLPTKLLQKMEKSSSDCFKPFLVHLIPVYSKFCPEDLTSLGEYLDYRLVTNYAFFEPGSLKADLTLQQLQLKLPSDFHKEVFLNKGIQGFLEKQIEEVVGMHSGIEFVLLESLGQEERMSDIRKRTRRAVDESQSYQTDKPTEGKPKEQKNSLVLFGKCILEHGNPAETLYEGIRNYTIFGKIIDLDNRAIGGDKTMITFKLVTKRSGLSCKMFLKKGEAVPPISNGQQVKIKGNVELDPYLRDFSMKVKDINQVEVETNKDEALVKRVELHLHTKMSHMDANIELTSLFTRMKQLGHDAVALTDHGVVQIYPEAFTLGQKYDIKVIYGLEGYLYDDEKERDHKGKANHVILLVKNQEGLKNLYRLVSESHLNYYHRRPKIPKSLLTANREGIIVGSACEAGELFRSMVSGASDEELIAIGKYYDYLEIQPISNNEYLLNNGMVESRSNLEDFNKRVIAIAEVLGKPVVATGDVHFLDKEDSIYRAILMKSKGFSDVTQPDLYYRTTEEMLHEFSYLDEEKAFEVVVTNPRAIAKAIESVRPIPVGLFTPEIEGAEKQVRDITMEQGHKQYGPVLPQLVQKRLDKELDSIISNGFAVLYLIAHRLVKKSNEDGYVVGSRGSVGSSLVATMMGITEVNPLGPHYVCPTCCHTEFVEGGYDCGIELPNKPCPECGTLYNKDGFNIPFETFLGFKGDKIPDIDLNFSGEYQPIIHKYTEELFGKGKVFKAGTISTVADKTAIGLVKKYYEKQNLPMPGDTDINALAQGCVGVKRTTGQHPGGLVVVPKNVDILDFTPVQRPADDVESDITTTHFDYHSINDCLVKLDLLGHDDPTMIKYLEEGTGVKVRDIPLDDPGVMSLFNSPEALSLEEKFVETGSLGLPEFGTSFVRKMLLDTKPKVFSDLIRISGFSHGTDVWLNNARDLIVGGKVKLKEAISTRDDIMVYLQSMGLDDIMAFKIMEDVRKGFGLKEEYVEDMLGHKVPKWYIESCNKISYMFPKAHATAYVVMAFRLGYYKLNYKEAFYAAYFSVRGGVFDINLFHSKAMIKEELNRRASGDQSASEKEVRNLLEIAYEMHLRGVTFAPIDLNASDASHFLAHGSTLLPPFSAIPGLGEKAGLSLVTERNKRPFLSVEDLRRRCRINNSIIEEMRKLGLFVDLPESEQLSLFI